MRVAPSFIAAAIALGSPIATALPEASPALELKATDAPVSSAKAPLPQRELDYIAIIDKARKCYSAGRSMDARRDARLTLQIDVHGFMGLTHDAQNWVGVLKNTHRTDDGLMALEIEIAPDVTITSWSNSTFDAGFGTLLKPFSEMGKTAQSLSIGDEVLFSADLIGGAISSDDDMVLHPRVIAAFQDLRKREDPIKTAQ